MNQPIRRIFHPSDFSAASNLAFAHALRVALAGHCDLTILHTGTHAGSPWTEFPRVRRTLEQWKMLPPNSDKEAIATLGLHVEKVVLPYRNPLGSILNFLARHPHDLIVLATHQYTGFDQWTHRQTAEPVARKSEEQTLFIPQGKNGFVNAASGEVQLHSVLVPVDRTTAVQLAMDAATALADSLGCRDAEATLLHVGDRNDAPRITLPEEGALKWRWMYREGDVEQEILRAAHEYHADLVVMATHGHDSLQDAFRGSITERIVRHAECPVLAVPAHRAVAHEHTVAENLATGRITI
ncbi:MAG TPA: universal stress protein [Terriglobia bacterium]|nr:universal stress protein [Terriglobia bacterium]